MMKKEIRLSNGYIILQDDEGFKVNSDTTLLGEFLDFAKYKKVLDIGTNNGALLFYAYEHYPSSLWGIDINEEALDIAKENLAKYDIKANLVLSDIKDFKEKDFEIIIVNPPFFKDTGQNRDDNLDRAKNEKYLDLELLFKSFIRLIKDNASIFMIYPAWRFLEVYEMCLKYKFKIQEAQFVYNNSNSDAKRVLLKLKRGHNKEIKIKKPIFIR